MKPFFAQIERDLLIAWQNRQDLGVMLVFFVIIIALFPLAIGANATVLDPLGVPVIWIAALLAILAGSRASILEALILKTTTPC